MAHIYYMFIHILLLFILFFFLSTALGLIGIQSVKSLLGRYFY